jgi:Protein of unknown function (DUF1579)
MVRAKEDAMIKFATFVISGALVSSALVARAADKAPAPAVEKAAAPAAEKAAAPAAAAPAEPPKPDPAVDALYKGWEGSWKCDTTFNAGSMGPGSPEMKLKTDVKIKKDLAGYWYRGEFKIKKTKAMPVMEGVFMLGYDAAAKLPVNITYDSMGGYAVETGALDATADKTVYVGEGHMMGMKAKFRETMIKKGDKAFEHSFDIDMGKGFAPMGTDECKK